MVVARGRGGGNGKLCNRFRISVMQDDKFSRDLLSNNTHIASNAVWYT